MDRPGGTVLVIRRLVAAGPAIQRRSVICAMATHRHHFDLFADYHQFYLQDEPVDGNLGDDWTQEATDRLLAITDGTIGVGTVPT